jgi:transcriptional regulator NrdR family protein
MNYPKVIKRDESSEDFSPEKLGRVVCAAGLNEEQSKLLIESIKSWLVSLGVNDIKSTKLRDAILDEMEKLNKPAAGLFRWYQQTKEEK